MATCHKNHYTEKIEPTAANDNGLFGKLTPPQLQVARSIIEVVEKLETRSVPIMRQSSRTGYVEIAQEDWDRFVRPRLMLTLTPVADSISKGVDENTLLSPVVALKSAAGKLVPETLFRYTTQLQLGI